MKKIALICTLVVVVAAATWAASTTDRVVPLKNSNPSTSLQALLNDLQQQAAAKNSQGTPRVTWTSLLNTAQMNKTNSTAPRAKMDLGNVRGGGSASRMLTQPNQSAHLNSNMSTAGAGSTAPRMLTQPNQTPRLKGDVGNVRGGGAVPRVVAKQNQTPRLTGDVSNMSRGGVAPRILSLEDQIDILESQIDHALVKHEDTAGIYEQLNALYAQRPLQTDMPSRGSEYASVDNVPVACGGDTCGSATAITSLPYCVTCTTDNTHDDYQPVCITGPSGPDVVFKYTPPTNQLVSISLCGSLFNTVLSVYDTCPSAVPGTVPRQPICCSDDGCGPNNLQSCCPGLQLLGGHTYYIIVDGANPAAHGQFVLHVTLGRVCASAPCFSDNHCPYPNREVDANDGCGEPDLPIVACGDTLCGEIRPNGDRDWYKIVIPEHSCRVVKIDVFGNDTPGFYPFGHGLDPRVSLFASDCQTLIGSDDDGGVGYDSRLITECLPAGVYFIRVVGVEGATGPYVLALTCRACDCPLPPCVECPANAVQEDEGCTPNSGSINGGCSDSPPQFGTVECGEFLCGTLWERAIENGYTRDTDWYRFVLSGRDSVRFTVKANIPYVAYVLQTVGAAAPCDSFAIFATSEGDTCVVTTLAACLPAGTYYFFVAAQFGNVFNCAHYLAHMECLPCSELPSCIVCPENGIQEDEGCTPNSASIDGGCNDVPPQYGQINCGELLCGSFWEANSGNLRDTDWYRFVLEQRDSVRFTVKADKPFSTYIVQLTGGAVPCDTILTPYGANGDSCEVVTVAACLPPGVYYFFVAPQFSLPDFECGRYAARMECLPCSELPPCVFCPENGVREDEGCTATSPSVDGGCNDVPPQFGQVECGENLCGTLWMTTNDAGQQFRDTDWYRFVLTERDSIWFNVKADRPFQADITRFTDPSNPCSYSVDPIVYGDSCQEVILAACLPPGVYVFFVGSQFGFSNFDCGHYVAHMGCLPCGEPESCVPCPPNGVVEDEGCTQGAPSANGGCNDEVPQFGQVHCGELLCGTFWETNDGNFRDTDWYRFVLEERDSVRFVVKADRAFQADILQVSSANAPCDFVAPAFSYGDSCNTVTLEACLPPGVYYFFVAPQFSLPNFDCGHYLAAMECFPCTERQTCIICPENARHEDEPCPNYPDNINGGCDAREPHFSRILCNDLVCGTAFAGFDLAGNRVIDEDWYELILPEGDSLRFCMRADFNAIFAIFFAGFNPSCDSASTQLVTAGRVDSCGETACIGACLPAGRYYLALAPIQTTDCGHYVIGTQCLPCQPTCFVCPENVPHEDEACLSYPDVTNGGCYGSGDIPHFSRLACNAAICGTSWYLPATTDSTSALFDTDWYQFDLEERDSVRFVVRSDFPAIFALAYYRNNVISCDSLSIVGELEVAPCQSLTAGICLPPGHYVLVILPDATISELPPIWCGHYLLAALCEPCERPCVQCPPNAAIEDEGCSPTAPPINNGCDTPPGVAPLFGHINCGQTICGTSWEFQNPNGGFIRDADWFVFSVEAPRDSVWFTYSADFVSSVTITQLGALAPCPGVDVLTLNEIGPCAADTFGRCLAPGTYAVVIRPTIGQVVECGHYVITMQCGQCTPCPEQWLVDGYDLGDLGPCYPTLPGNPAHGISGIAWLGQTITAESSPTVGGDDGPVGGDDGVQYLHLPWTPCAIETVVVTVTGGPHYDQYARCDGQLYLNGWKDGNLDGDFCDTMWCGGAAARIMADEWIVQDLPVTPGVYTLPVRDPGVFDLGIYNGVFRWRLTSRPVGRNGFGLATTQCPNQQCGNFAVDFLGEVEDYILHDAQLDVSLTSFDAVPGDNQVTLHWVTVSETGNDYFRIMRNNSPLAQVTSQGNGADRHVYTYTDDRAVNGAAYTYTLVAVDQTGGGTVLQTVSSAPSASAATITEYALHQNYPNPFNPTTNIVFDLVDGGFVSLKVYNLVGQVVATMVNGNLAKGQHTVSFDATNLPTGIYVYRLEVNGFSEARKMLLTK